VINLVRLCHDRKQVQNITDRRMALNMVLAIDITGISLEPCITQYIPDELVKLGTERRKESLRSNQRQVVPARDIAPILWPEDEILGKDIPLAKNISRLRQKLEVPVERMTHNNSASVREDEFDHHM